MIQYICTVGEADPLPTTTTPPKRVQASYDAAQTNTENTRHWAAADTLDPHASASLKTRQVLRSRSRYEVLENNPYLKGTVLSICNDFVGRNGPKLRITDSRFTQEQRQKIVRKWLTWAKVIGLTRKLWQMRLAKIVDGETFLFPFNKNQKRTKVALNYQVIETDQVSGPLSTINRNSTRFFEIDGVRWDLNNEPVSYHKLRTHPGSSIYNHFFREKTLGQWYEANDVIHWFRNDRGWLRGIPELTPSLPLCALLRRYTLATVLQKELAADFSGVLETQGPANTNYFNPDDDDPFDTFPVERGLIVTMPWGTKITQLNPVPDGFKYDEYVGALLREIVRPALTTFNIAAGTSKDSNMASGVLDASIYKSGQNFERSRCAEIVLDQMMSEWWTEAVLTGEISGDKDDPPEHEWGWDKIGIDHTDPVRVAESLQILHDNGFITDRDIQEEHMNRTVEEWQMELEEQITYRQAHPLPPKEEVPEPVAPAQPPQEKSNAQKE